MKTAEKSKVLEAMQNKDRFKKLDDGWIQDSFLGLDWGPSSKGYMDYEKAVAYCEENGGRLPEIHELHSLVDFTKSDPCINKIFKDTKSSWYWSATPVEWRSDKARWVVSFYSGGVDSSLEGSNYCAHPVRASQC